MINFFQGSSFGSRCSSSGLFLRLLLLSEFCLFLCSQFDCLLCMLQEFAHRFFGGVVMLLLDLSSLGNRCRKVLSLTHGCHSLSLFLPLCCSGSLICFLLLLGLPCGLCLVCCLLFSCSFLVCSLLFSCLLLLLCLLLCCGLLLNLKLHLHLLSCRLYLAIPEALTEFVEVQLFTVEVG